MGYGRVVSRRLLDLTSPDGELVVVVSRPILVVFAILLEFCDWT
jgi:hypothetical protein